MMTATVARTFDETYDVSTATISADGLAFTNSDIMETGNSMRIVDASAAIPNAISGKRLQAFTEQTYEVDFTDTINGKDITFVGKHTDKLSQDTAQTTLTYTVGDKVVGAATLTGAIDWSDGGVHYENGGAANQNNVNAVYKFDGNSAVDISGVAFSATKDPLAGETRSMTLLQGVDGVVAGNVAGAPSFAVALDQTNTKLDAKASGTATVTGNDVTYTVDGVVIDAINVKSVGDSADAIPDNWTLAKDGSGNVLATVETDTMTVPSGLNPGEVKTIVTATVANYFDGVAVKGSHVWKEDGSELTADLDIGGVAITGTQTAGGVKVDEADKSQIVYEESKKKINTVSLGEVTFAKDGVARSFDNTYDLTSATINTGSLAFANPEVMECGNSMTIVDATAAIQNTDGETMKALDASAKTSFDVAYTDTIDGKNLTLEGTRTDTLSQEDDAATSTKNSKLIYTVGNKNVDRAAFDGTVDFSNGAVHYKADGDYQFGSETKIDAAKLAFKESISLRESCIRQGFLTAERFDEVFHPEEMV